MTNNLAVSTFSWLKSITTHSLCTALTSSDLDDSIVEEIFADEVFTRHIEALNYLVDQAEGAECNEFVSVA